MIPEHKCYCEVFAGASWLLFRKEPSQVEVINDINSDLVRLYRVVKHHLDEFVRYFRWALTARDEFERLKLERPETLTDIQRAARFYYLLKMGFGSKIPCPTFGVATTSKPSLNLLRIEEELSAAHLRLAQVYVENLPYADLIRRYDRPHTFFYLDPPYYGCEDYYGKGIFSRGDFEALAAILRDVEGRFILSINDAPEVRETFKAFQVVEVGVTYSVSGPGSRKRVSELLYHNV